MIIIVITFFHIVDLYSIEFQKRVLPHILLFLHPSSKYPTLVDIDKVNLAEIPCPEKEPCGITNKSSPCMKNGSCSWYYPKKFHNTTIFSQKMIFHVIGKEIMVSML